MARAYLAKLRIFPEKKKKKKSPFETSAGWLGETFLNLN